MVPEGVTRPTLPAPVSVNHRLPSAPVVMKRGVLPIVGVANSVIVPDGVTRPSLSLVYSVNQRLPSGPSVMHSGLLPLMGVANSLIVPAGVTLPILLPESSVNQRLPSGPVAMKFGSLAGAANSVMVPAGVIRAILSAFCSVNQRLPSGPLVMKFGPLLLVGVANSTIVWAGALMAGPPEPPHAASATVVVTSAARPATSTCVMDRIVMCATRSAGLPGSRPARRAFAARLRFLRASASRRRSRRRVRAYRHRRGVCQDAVARCAGSAMRSRFRAARCAG